MGERRLGKAGALACAVIVLLSGAAIAAAPPAEGPFARPIECPAPMAACRGPAGPAADPAAAGEAVGWPGWSADADGVFTLAVFGDSLADGYWGGVYRALARQDEFEILRHARNATGLSRSDYFDWGGALEDHLADPAIDAALISMGANDHQSIYLGDRRYLHYDSDGWDDAYLERAVSMMSRLKAAGVSTFWVGLPMVRDDTRAAAARRLNGLYAEAAAATGVTFIPLWDLTAGDGGAYVSYLPDEDGRSRQMRANDGVHFTSRGYSMIAEHLLTVMDAELSLFAEREAP